MSKSVKLGYEVVSGAAVFVPLRHTAVIGETQQSGKTTTLEAINMRLAGEYRMPAIAFVTKRGEKSFRLKRSLPLFFREPKSTAERPLWQWVASIVEATDCTVGKEEEAALIEASDAILARESYPTGKTLLVAGEGKRPKKVPETKMRIHSTGKPVKTLEEVAANVRLMLGSARGKLKSTLIRLDAYFKIVVPQIERIRKRADGTGELLLAPGLNVMDLEGLPDEMKMLVIASVIEEIYLHGRNTVVIIPEAAKYIPQRRNTPVRLIAELFAREGLVVGNVLMLDSQDLANVAVEVRKHIGVYILGKQGEINEVQRTVQTIPEIPRIQPVEIMQLGKGEFYVVGVEARDKERKVRKVYVQPAGMEDEHARAIATGEETADSWRAIERGLPVAPELAAQTLAQLAAPQLLQLQEQTDDGNQADSELGESESDRGSGQLPGGDGPQSFRMDGEADESDDAIRHGSEQDEARGGEAAPESEREAEGGKLDMSEAKLWRDKYEALEARVDVLLQTLSAMYPEITYTLDENGVPDVKIARIPATAPLAAPQRSGGGNANDVASVTPAPPFPRKEDFAIRDTACQASETVSFLDSFNGRGLEVIREKLIPAILQDPRVLVALDAARPELQIAVARPRIDWSDASLKGKLAKLIGEGFFQSPREHGDILAEAKRRGFVDGKSKGGSIILNPLNEMVELGFLTREAAGYQIAPGAKVTVRESL